MGSPNLEIVRPPEFPLLQELASIGVVLDSIWSTMHIKKMPPEAFKIIWRHLQLDYSNQTKQGIAGALGRREARDVVWNDLLQLYRKLEPDQGANRLKEAVASSLHVMAQPKDLDTLVDLLSNPGNGPSRVFFVRNLSRMKKPRALETLIELRSAPDLSPEIEVVLKAKGKRKRKRRLRNS